MYAERGQRRSLGKLLDVPVVIKNFNHPIARDTTVPATVQPAASCIPQRQSDNVRPEAVIIMQASS